MVKVVTLTILILLSMFIMFVFMLCAIVDISMPLFLGHTLNLTSRFFNLLKLKKLSNLLYLEINYKE